MEPSEPNVNLYPTETHRIHHSSEKKNTHTPIHGKYKIAQAFTIVNKWAPCTLLQSLYKRVLFDMDGVVAQFFFCFHIVYPTIHFHISFFLFLLLISFLMLPLCLRLDNARTFSLRHYFPHSTSFLVPLCVFFFSFHIIFIRFCCIIAGTKRFVHIERECAFHFIFSSSSNSTNRAQ